MAEKKTVVLYPGLVGSHFVPMMHLAAALMEHGFAISVALIHKEDAKFGAVVRRAAASMPAVRFHTLAAVEDPPKLTDGTQFFRWYMDLVRSYNERLREFLRSSSARVQAVVVDCLHSQAIDVAKRLGIPSYTFFPTSAATLAAFAQLPAALAEAPRTSSGELGDAPLQLLGMPPMPASHLMREMLQDPLHMGRASPGQ
jgi:hypothetical protein